MIQFTDCSNCGKRVRLDAQTCHRCKASLVGVPSDFRPTEHAATGGYDTSNDDFSYDDFLAEEFGEQNDRTTRRGFKWYWRWTAWVLVFVMLSYFIYALLSLITYRVPSSPVRPLEAQQRLNEI